MTRKKGHPCKDSPAPTEDGENDSPLINNIIGLNKIFFDFREETNFSLGLVIDDINRIDDEINCAQRAQAKLLPLIREIIKEELTRFFVGRT